MAHIVADRVVETSVTTGTGALTLAGAVTGFQAFSDVCADADTAYYVVWGVDANAVPTGEWETGLGTWGTGGVLTRTSVKASSNADAAVAFSAGTKRVALSEIAFSLANKQPLLVSGTNIKTVGSTTLLGSGDIPFPVTLAGAEALTNKTINGSSNTITNVSLTAGVTGTLPVANGGTGLASPTANRVLLSNGTSAMQTVAPGTSGNVLTSNGTTWASAAPSSLTGITEGATNGNTELGTSIGTGTSSNVFIGYRAAQNFTSGNYNVVVGALAMDNAGLTVNTEGVAIGYQAGSGVNLTEMAERSVLVGYQAGYSAGENYCVAIGHSAGYQQAATGGGGVCIGYQAGYGASRQSNYGSVSIGFQAAYSCAGARFSVAVGRGSLFTISTGDENTAVGYQAGYDISTGNQNTMIGSYAGNSGTNDLTTGSNNTVIGYNAGTAANNSANTVTLGNSSIATLRCQVTTITALSDARDKTDVTALDAGLGFLNQLRPVRFTWNMRDGGKVGEVDTGFIAQELKSVQEQTGISIPGLIYEDNPDRLEAGYGKLLPVLVKAIQELSAEVAALKARLEGQT